jgi:small-conductance mechanosensitive channel
MLGWIETCLLLGAGVLLVCGLTPQLRSYRSLFWGGGVLLAITALFPRPGNVLGQQLFAGASGAPHLMSELFGIAWWILGAWVVKSLLDLVLHRTIFPDDNEPHARRLFADLASVLVYVVALVGIMDTVFKQPISAVLATSGVLAIVLGLALQNTLSDVFSGLAINIERPFGAGDWITVTDQAEGQVIEINWRATRIKTAANEMVVIPNSVVAKAIVTNHRRLNDPHICTIEVKIDHRVSPTRVLDALQAAAGGSSGIAPGTSPTAYACGFTDALVAYELAFAIDDYTRTAGVQSEVIRRVADAFQSRSIHIGSPGLDVRIAQQGDSGVAKSAVLDAVAKP